jgi:hypothetical protein
MLLTLNSKPVLLEDPQGDFSQWLDRWQSLADKRLFGTARDNQIYNWPLPPQLKLNTYYKPWGATRWGFGLFLVNDAVLNSGNNSINSASSYLLEMKSDDGATTFVSENLYLLPHKVIGQTFRDSQADEDVHLIALVDERYKWQFVSTVGQDFSSVTTWSGLVDSLKTLAETQIEIQGDIDTFFGTPDIQLLQSHFSTVGGMLDAICASTGSRLVWEISRAVLVAADQAYGDFLNSNPSRNKFITGSVDISRGTFDYSADCPETTVVSLPDGSLSKNADHSAAVAFAQSQYSCLSLANGNLKSETHFYYGEDITDDIAKAVAAANILWRSVRPEATLAYWGESTKSTIAANLFADCFWMHFAYQSGRVANNDNEALDGNDNDYSHFYGVYSLPHNFGTRRLSSGGEECITPIELTEDIYPCGQALACSLDLSTAEPTPNYSDVFWVDDFFGLSGTVGHRGWAKKQDGETRYHAGQMIDVYKLVNLGPTCDDSSSSDSSDSSSGSSGSSGSQGSGSNGSSGSSGASSSSSLSDSQESSLSDSGESGESASSSGSGSSKDTAVVPATWTDGKYVKLAAVEAPFVGFIDLISSVVINKDTLVPIDPHFIEVCEEGTMEVFCSVKRRPIGCCADIEDGNVIVQLADYSQPTRVNLLLIAKRKTFKNWRFKEATKADFDWNEERLTKGRPTK